MFMKNLQIGYRLGLSYTFMVLLIVLMTGYAFVQFGVIREHVVYVSQNNNQKLKLIFEMNASIQNVSRTVGQLAAIEDTATLQAEKKFLEQERARYQEIVRQFEGMDMSGKGKTLLDNLKSSVRRSSEANNRVVEMAMSGRREEAGKELSRAVPLMKELSTNAHAMMEFQNERIEYRSGIALSALNNTRSGLVIGFLIAILMATACGMLITRSIVQPLRNMRDTLHDIAEGEGDLTRRLETGSRDELGEVAQWFNQFVEKLHGIVSMVSNATVQVAAASAQLHATSGQMAAGASDVAMQIGTVATAGEEMSATSADIAGNCSMAADGARQAADAAVSGARVVDEAIGVMNSISERVRATAKSVEELGSRSEQIGAIVGTIQDIADQTNLLALNAAIEAARAGDQGRGFAVVADEVRALAERTTRATREISEMIGAIQGETKSAVEAMVEGVGEVTRGGEKAAESGKALERIIEQINEVTMQINQVATAAEEQTATTAEISGNMQKITDIVNMTSHGANESADAATQLSAQADSLSRIVGQFKL